MKLSEFQRALIAAVQEGLPAGRDPFGDIAAALSVSRENVIAQLDQWRRNGVLRRAGAILDQRRLGLAGNVMVAWRVPDDSLESVGKRFAGRPEVTHCYARRPGKDWPYNLYTMLHARNEPTCRQIVAQMAQDSGVGVHLELFTVREFKKTAPRYFQR